MNRVLKALTVVSLVFATLPPALAKSPTVKVTISGGALAHEIDVTDPRTLDLSSVWGGTFLDASAAPGIEPARAVPTYEVWFYTKSGDGGMQRRYVVYYSPGQGEKRGLIYLPGKGQPWYWLNVHSILRDDRDGKWNYASPHWEELVNSAIAGGQTTR
jgi:hypothetical protein